MHYVLTCTMAVRVVRSPPARRRRAAMVRVMAGQGEVCRGAGRQVCRGAARQEAARGNRLSKLFRTLYILMYPQTSRIK